jgi:choline dehydrogenase-like flavoprotein
MGALYAARKLQFFSSFTSHLFSGKTLGGSTSINGAAWTRGLNAQYDALSDLLEPSEANMNWNWDSLFTYMKKVCTQRLSSRDRETDRF